MSDLPVLFDELPTACGGRIGVATLNAPKSLNALSLEMVHQLEAKLDAWAVDRSIVAVWLEGSGDKAFCAGGDVVALYRSLTEEGENRGSGRDSLLAETYFTAEYHLDHRIHTYPKPLMVWGDGIVMGGGLGLMAGGFQRLVTETTRIAMPEITIGLYPDIGASWFLNRMPPGVGAYLGLTGAQLNARDALDLGLADRFIPRERRSLVREASESYATQIARIEWQVRELLLAEQHISLHISQLISRFYTEAIETTRLGTDNSESLTRGIIGFAITVGLLSVLLILVIIFFIADDLNKGQRARVELAREKQLTEELIESRHRLLL